MKDRHTENSFECYNNMRLDLFYSVKSFNHLNVKTALSEFTDQL